MAIADPVSDCDPSHVSTPVADSLATLTPRQRQVLTLLVEERSDLAIAAALGISRRTASNHVAAILHRLGVETRKSAVRRAAEDGLIP